MSFLLFCLGIQMMIMLLAAGYRFIDLWYRISDFWLSNSLRLLGLLALDGIVLHYLPPELRDAFVWGQGAYLVFHIAIYWIIRLGLWVVVLRRDHPNKV